MHLDFMFYNRERSWVIKSILEMKPCALFCALGLACSGVYNALIACHTQFIKVMSRKCNCIGTKEFEKF